MANKILDEIGLSYLWGKLKNKFTNQEDFNTHADDNSIHITSTERDKWDEVTEKIESEPAVDFGEAKTPEFQENINTLNGKVDELKSDLSNLFDNRIINKFNPNTTKTGYVFDNTVNPTTDWFHSDYIEVSEGVTYSAPCVGVMGCYYDESKNFISNIAYENLNTYGAFTVPQGVKFIKVNGYLGSASTQVTTSIDTYMCVNSETLPSVYVPYDEYAKEKTLKEKHSKQTFVDEIGNSKLAVMTQYGIQKLMEKIFDVFPKNVFNKATASVGYLADNTLYPNTDFFYSDYISVNVGETYSIPYNVSVLGEFYDADKNYIKTFYTSDGIVHDTYTTFSIPEGCAYIRVNGFTGTSAEYITSTLDTYMCLNNSTYYDEYIPYNLAEFRLKELANFSANGILTGKKLYISGDSLTHGNANEAQSNGTYLTYGSIVAERNAMEFVNNGSSGSTMGNVIVGGQSKSGYSVERYKNIPSDADIITLWFGWNDAYYGKIMYKDEYCQTNFGKYYLDCTTDEQATCNAVQDWKATYIGSEDSTDNRTWCGAWNTVLTYIRNNFPNAKLGVLIPFLNNEDEDFRTALKNICTKHAVPYIDTANPNEWFNTGYSKDISSATATLLKSRYTVDGLHMNILGYQMQANGYEDFIKRI